MTLVTTSDTFTRSTEALNKSGGSWVGTTTNPFVNSNNQCGTGAANAGWVIHVDTHAGPQTSKLTIKSLGTATTKAAVLACVDDTATQPGSYLNLYATAFPSFYRFRATATAYELQRKNSGGSGTTTLDTYAATPAANDVIEIRYNPTTKVVTCYVNTTLQITYDDSATSLPTTQTRVGFHIDSGTIVDDWVGTWTTADGGGGGGSGGWQFSEWSGGTAPTGSEVNLTVDGEYNGATIPDLDVASTIVYPTDDSTLPLVQPMWSDALRDGFGVNCHYKFATSGNVHYYVDNLTAYLIELGCGWVRDRPVNSTQGSLYTNQWEQFEALQAAGIGQQLTLSQSKAAGWWNTTSDHYDEYWGDISDRLAAHPTWRFTVGGANEPDDLPQVSGWVTKLRNQMKLSYDRRAVAGMEAVPIFAPSLKDGQAVIEDSYTDFGATDVYQWIDGGDYHRYPLGKNTPDPAFDEACLSRTPSYLQDLRIGWAKAAYKTERMYCTEGGYNTDLKVTAGGEHIPEDVDAYYKERHLFELVGLRGIQTWFQYELMDDPDSYATNADGTIGNDEAHRGLIFTPQLSPSSWVKKQAFTRLKTLMAQVRDVGGGYDPRTNPYVPPKFRMEITCADSQFRSVLTAKRAGEVRLYYWLDKALWNTATDARITLDAVSFDVETTNGTQTLSATGVVQSVVLQ